MTTSINLPKRGNLQSPYTAIAPLIVTESNAAQGFEIKSRVTPALTTIPVPLIRPTTANKVIALDVMPNGTPFDFGDNGVAWIDVCNVDVHNNDLPIAAARVGIGTTKAQFGTVVFNGYSTVLPIEFLQNSVVRFRINSDTSMNFFTSSMTITNGLTVGSVTTPLVKAAASGNTNLVLQPSGSGAFQVNPTDNTAAGGNARGTYAVDLQLGRAAATQVASGAYSFTAGLGCTASNVSSCGLGYFASSSGVGAAALGYFSSANGNYSFAVGESCLASAQGAIALGRFNTASGLGSTAVGAYGWTKDINNIFIIGSGVSLTTGKYQTNILDLGVETTNATATILRSTSLVAGNNNELLLQNNSAMVVKGLAIAADSTLTDVKSWEVIATVKRGANPGTTALEGSPVVTVLNQSAGASTWTLAITVNISTGCLQATVTNEAGRTIRTNLSLYASEVAF